MKKRRVKTSKLFLTVWLLVILFGITNIIIKEYKIYKIKQEQAATQMRIDALKKEEAALKSERKKLDDPKHIEKIAREEFNMVGKGEVPIIIVDKNKKQKK